MLPLLRGATNAANRRNRAAAGMVRSPAPAHTYRMLTLAKTALLVAAQFPLNAFLQDEGVPGDTPEIHQRCPDQAAGEATAM
jgi:hypothetical protein